MIPVLFSFGPFHIYSFGAAVAAGIFFSLYLMHRQALKDGFPKTEEVTDWVFVTVLSGFLGSRLLYILQNLGWYMERPLEIFYLWEGGLIFYGGVVAAVAALIIYFRKKKIPVLKGFDFLFIYLALTHAFGRLGCFLNGCCYGTQCDLPWAIRFPNQEYAVHPTQLYEGILDLGLFFFLRARYNHKKWDGQIMSFYLIGYGIIRFVVEIFRADNPVTFSLTWNQWISIAFIFAGLCFKKITTKLTGQVHHA